MRVAVALFFVVATALKVPNGRQMFGKGAWCSGRRHEGWGRAADGGGEGGSTTSLRCTSIDPADALEVTAPGARGKKQNQRFIHPQVYKMFHRAQYLMKTGENVVAQRLLLRCLELNPFDSHRYIVTPFLRPSADSPTRRLPLAPSHTLLLLVLCVCRVRFCACV